LEDAAKRFRIPLDRSTTLKYRLVHWSSASRYRELWALDGVSFEVAFGEFVGIIGRNGSGKSTLLKVLSRILPVTRGKVTITGPVSPFLELGVGFNPELSARENVLVNGAILGLSSADLRSRMGRILGFAELEEFADQKLKNFSSGMQVRLAFSVAIEADAGILLMDEVLAVGDASFQEKCFDVFNRYRREGRTVVLVTHDLGAVENFCDRAILLDHGRVVADGRPVDVTRTYRRIVVEHPGADVPAGGEGRRWGTGEARIANVELLDGNNRPTHRFETGSPLTVRVTCRAREPIGDLLCAFDLRRADGLPITSFNSYMGGCTFPALEAEDGVVVEYRIRSLPLLGGAYRLSIGLHNRRASQPLDQMQDAFEFKVHSETGSAGLFELGGEWLVERVQGTTPMPRSA
jgi:ABC-type polysaccharide/polyol phosphate transport system ATPase subunit